ncbi:MAG: tripartite tricarboxylate transporter substrate binding protein [Betaproteobacteria bacterium]|nr:tripartite tricarboxylate transporter substrate binding protein [Betaproteobacteria bacterium]
MATKRLGAVLCAALFGFTSVAAVTANAAEYPTRPIRYVVAFAPGGINDIMARIVAQKLNEAWGQPVVVDNRPGAGGNLAAELVAKTTPDGYTFMNISTAHTIAQTLYTKLNYSLARDLTPVVVLGSAPLIMVVNPGIPAKNVTELIAWAKKNRLIYASGGAGVISHLSMEMFKLAAGIDATHVPYRGVGPAVPDLISGQAHVMFNAVPELFPHAKGGRLRIIAVLTEKRHPFMPEVPTMIEQGYKEFVMGNWTGIVAPAKTPKAVVNKLATEITRIIRSPDTSKRLLEMGVDPLGGTAEEFGKLIRSETERFGKAVKASGAKAD